MEKNTTTERDPGMQEIVDAINETSDPEKTFNVLIAILKAAYGK